MHNGIFLASFILLLYAFITKHKLFYCRALWVVLFGLGIGYGYLLYTPFLQKWYYNPVYMAVDSSHFDVANIPFPAITICSNNKVVDRQVESVLLTQPWRGLAKRDAEFATHFRRALTAIVMARENPAMLDDLQTGTIDILNKYSEKLFEVLKKVSLPYLKVNLI